MSFVRRSSREKKTTEDHYHHDVAKTLSSKHLNDPCIYPRTGRRGAPQVFPRKLYQMMNEAPEDVITWTPQGKSFIILDMETFSEEVLLNYFRHQKYSSFQRQLNLYGFHKISKGPETGSYMHDSFVRGRPDLLIDVRRLPQRIAASVAKMNKQLKVKVKTSKGSSKVLVSNSSKPSALSRMTSCLKSKQHESSDESEGNSESEYESPNFTPTLNHNSSIESEDGSEENNNVFISQEYEGFVSFLDGNEDILPQIDEEELDHHHQKDQDGIVKVQPLPKECYVPSSSIATISEGVNQMAIEKLSPRIAFAKHTNVHINENNNNTKPWSVKFNKPTTPNSLQSMIPVLGRCDSSMTKISESDNNDDDDVKLSTFLENEIETLEKEQPFSDSNRSKSFTVDTAILQEFASPPVFSSRLSSDDWNMTEPQQLTNNQLTTMFSLARKESIEAPPQPILMERR